MKGPVFLIGFMGTGKSEVGRLLSKELEWVFRDVDEMVEAEAGRSIPEIFEEEGESGFRRRERAALLKSMASSNSVVSCGGGIVVTPENLEDLLRQPYVYRLRAEPKTIFERVGSDPHRPLLQGEGDPLGRIGNLLNAREPLYRKFEKQVVTDGFRPSEVVGHILSDLRKSSIG